MVEARERKQTDFESGWAVSYDEVCSFDGVRLLIRIIQIMITQSSCDVLSPPAVLYR